MPIFRYALVAAVLFTTACAPTVESAARQASRAAVDQSVTELNDEKTKQELEGAVEDPRFAEATAKLAEQIADGVVRSLASPQTRVQLTSVATSAAGAASRELIQSLSSQEAQMAFAGLARGAAGGLTDPVLQDSLTKASEAAAYGAVTGANHGLTNVWNTADDGPMAALRGFSRGGTWLPLLVILAGLMTLALFFGAAIVLGLNRRARANVARLESATLLLATAMRDGGDRAETHELLAAVRDSLEQSTRARFSHSPTWWPRSEHRQH